MTRSGESERRDRVLTDADIAELLRRIDEAEDRRWQRQMESIGYDVTSQESRAQILADHNWVRDWRTGSTRAKMVAMMMLLTAILGGVGKIFWDGAASWLKTIANAKGAGV